MRSKAVALQQKARENNPRHPQSLLALTETLVYAGRYAEALEASRLTQSIDPLASGGPLYETWVNWVWKGADGLPDARAAIDRVPGDRSDTASHYHLRQLFYEGREEEVLEFARSLGEFVRYPEGTYPVSLAPALALERLGRAEEARAAYREAAESLERELERTPDDFRLHGPLGYAYAALGRREEALATAERGHEILSPRGSLHRRHVVELTRRPTKAQKVVAGIGGHDQRAVENAGRIPGHDRPHRFASAVREIDAIDSGR